MSDQTTCYIECECPVTHADWDEYDALDPDATIRCLECDSHHRLGYIGQLVITGDEWSFLGEDKWRAAYKAMAAVARRN